MQRRDGRATSITGMCYVHQRACIGTLLSTLQLLLRMTQQARSGHCVCVNVLVCGQRIKYLTTQQFVDRIFQFYPVRQMIKEPGAERSQWQARMGGTMKCLTAAARGPPSRVVGRPR